MATRTEPGPWAREFDDLGRALGGALLFGAPLLFTMEMWWIGEQPGLWKILGFLALGLVLNVFLAEAVGFRRQVMSPAEIIPEAVDSMAIGIVAAFVVLLVLNQISLDQPLSSIVASVAIQSVPLSIGASVADTVFSYRSSHNSGEGQSTPISAWRASINDIGATAIGGLVIGISIAPTEEIPMLATEMSFAHQAALVVLTLLVTYIIGFESGFSPQRAILQEDQSVFRHPLTQTAVAYLVSFLLAFLALYFFHQIDLGDNGWFVLSQVIIFTFPVALGGAAGRLVI